MSEEKDPCKCIEVGPIYPRSKWAYEIRPLLDYTVHQPDCEHFWPEVHALVKAGAGARLMFAGVDEFRESEMGNGGGDE